MVNELDHLSVDHDYRLEFILLYSDAIGVVMEAKYRLILETVTHQYFHIVYQYKWLISDFIPNK